MWTAVEMSRKRRELLQNALKEAQRKLGNARFYRDGSEDPLSHRRWCEVEADLMNEITILQTELSR